MEVLGVLGLELIVGFACDIKEPTVEKYLLKLLVIILYARTDCVWTLSSDLMENWRIIRVRDGLCKERNQND